MSRLVLLDDSSHDLITVQTVVSLLSKVSWDGQSELVYKYYVSYTLKFSPGFRWHVTFNVVQPGTQVDRLLCLLKVACQSLSGG